MTFMSRVTILGFILPLFVRGGDKTITLFNVETATETPTGAYTFPTVRPLGVGADGATTYAWDWPVSNSIVVGGTKAYTDPAGNPTTIVIPGETVTTGTKTFTYTMVGDATKYQLTQIPPPRETGDKNIYPAQAFDCTLDGNGGGSCVEKEWWPEIDPDYTVTSIYTGVARPFVTLTVQDNGVKSLRAVGSLLGLGVFVGVWLGL